MSKDHAVIVGAGQAGSVVAIQLRAEGFAGAITLIGAEPLPPYQRPPLSKSFLTGATRTEELFLRPASFYADQGIDLRTGVTIAAIDPVASRIETETGETIAYDRLCLATGAIPRRLPPAIGGALDGVVVLRNAADAQAMAARLQAGRAVVIIGGGYLGLEMAATAVERGMSVTVVEAAPRILQRVAAPQTSDVIRDLHAAKGVTILEDTRIGRIVGERHVRAVELVDGRSLPADLVIVAIGVDPDTRLAASAGLVLENGIAVDAQMRTSAAGIWAAGDCAAFVFRGRRQRIESVGNAIDSAEIVAKSMMGNATAYIPMPWFWSDQYEARLQIAGHNEGYDAVHTRQGSAGLSHWYYRGAELLAVDAINDSRAYIAGKRLIEMGRSPAPSQVTDAGIDLKTLLRG